MAQVLIRQYSMDPLIHAIASNPRRRPLIRDMLDDSGAIAIKIGNAFRERYPNHEAPGRHPGGRRGREQQFYAKHCIVYTAQEGNDRRGGFAVLDGELIGLHHVDKGLGDWLMRAAVDAGARKLCCLGTPHLLSLYTRHGFTTVRVERNTDDPKGPECHFMEILK